MKVRIKKIASQINPKYPTAEQDKWHCGEENDDYSPPIEYEIEGELVYPITLGKAVLVHRSKRNGVEADGVFQSSNVKTLGLNSFETLNSIYEIEYL